ncbi:alkaline phosphatase family protein [Chengkuizengella axinellae]|uniref:Alkaline phosphatase family protein n=1 Tax=Chengkuizengella axinellae TaxID=3064388 RepID=A0ABT9J072_9BACL|nr:alkaline phosphatase family protein [Chengkuizengella sp. 2205SS18-9]MDP5274424.1 alkaline phosphatase family protein [Chengkuizengella sp. 2205SS18-9]
MMPKALIILIDGCAKEYLEQGVTPNILEVGKRGFHKMIKSALPSVTNVNHATILTGSFPIEHQVAGNYFYNPETGEHGYIQGKGFLNKETILDFYASRGASTGLFVVKGKVQEVFGENVTFGLNAEKTDPEMIHHLGMEMPPETVSKPEANNWIMEACYKLLEKENPDLVYCTTNDYTMHNYEPDTDVAKKQMEVLDYWIGKMLELDPEREIYITADHGMQSKTLLVDLQKKLDKTPFDTFCMLPLKDRYLENHRYQEGSAIYIFAKDKSQTEDLLEHLKTYDFVESIYTKEEAVKELLLPPDPIGDIVIFSTREVAFGELEDEELEVNVRTHGSKFEQDVPILAVNARRPKEDYEFNCDIVKFMMQDLSK